MFTIGLGQVLEPEDGIATEAGAFHHPAFFEFVCGDDGPTVRTGVCNDAHC